MDNDENKEQKTQKLTEKQERFCISYVLNNGNAAKAAREAGYSEDSDEQIGYENLIKPYIVKRINELRKELEIEDFGITAEWIISRLKAVVERSMQLEKVKVTISTLDGGQLKEEGIYEFNANGANKALDQLAKIKSMYVDKPKDEKPKFESETEEIYAEEAEFTEIMTRLNGKFLPESQKE